MTRLCTQKSITPPFLTYTTCVKLVAILVYLHPPWSIITLLAPETLVLSASAASCLSATATLIHITLPITLPLRALSSLLEIGNYLPDIDNVQTQVLWHSWPYGALETELFPRPICAHHFCKYCTHFRADRSCHAGRNAGRYITAH